MARLGRLAYLVPLLGALAVCVFVFVEMRMSFSETRASQEKLRQCSQLRDGIFDLYQTLNACERFNSSYLLTRNKSYLEQYREHMEILARNLAREERAAERLLGGDLVTRILFQSAHKRIEELEAKIAESQRSNGDRVQLVLRSAPTQAMARFRLSHRTANANLREMDEEISHSLLQALDRRGFLLVGGAMLSALLLSLAFFQLNASLTQSRKLLADVQLAEQRYHLLANRVQDRQEEEKALLARQVHDELGQSLTAAKIDLAMALRIAESDPAGVSLQIRRAMDSLDTAVRDIRRVSTELRPGILDQMGLEPALEWLVHEFGKRTGMVVEFRCPPGVELNEKGSVVAFRIAQEALTNVARHAQATRIAIEGKVEGGTFVLTIEDNGVGFRSEKLDDPHSIGLFGMRDRAAAVGGRIEIQSESGRGTKVRVLIPLMKDEVRGVEGLRAEGAVDPGFSP